jgi:hypothetical protein
MRSKNKELLFCISHLHVYETPAGDEEKQNILQKTHLLGHFGIYVMVQVIHQNLNMHWNVDQIQHDPLSLQELLALVDGRHA